MRGKLLAASVPRTISQRFGRGRDGNCQRADDSTREFPDDIEGQSSHGASAAALSISCGPRALLESEPHGLLRAHNLRSYAPDRDYR
jgi:hypothetical protein